MAPAGASGVSVGREGGHRLAGWNGVRPRARSGSIVRHCTLPASTAPGLLTTPSTIRHTTQPNPTKPRHANREYIGSKLVAFAKAHEHVTVKTELKRNAHPIVTAEYGAWRWRSPCL